MLPPPSDLVNAQLKAGSIEEVSDDGAVTLRLPTGACEVVWIPLEHVIRVRAQSHRAREVRSRL